MVNLLEKWKIEHEADLKDLRFNLHMLRQNPLAMMGLILLILFVFTAIFGSWISPYDPFHVNLSKKLLPPSLEHFFGTDSFGRDILSRVIHGSNITLKIGLIAIAIEATIGTIVGMTAGYFKGKFSNVAMRITDGLLAFPSLILAMAIAIALGPSPVNTAIAIGFGGIPWYVRLARAQTLSIMENQYIEAARSLGAGDGRIIFRHVLPNCTTPIVVQATLRFGYIILTVAALSFIGLGAQPPTPEWGLMIAEGRGYIISGEWWISIFPGLAIMGFVIALNLLGDALRDILDPRLRR